MTPTKGEWIGLVLGIPLTVLYFWTLLYTPHGLAATLVMLLTMLLMGQPWERSK